MVLFKVYIVGNAIKVVRRFSLPDVSRRELSKAAGVFRFPRVSCAAASADDADLDPNIAGKFLFIVTGILCSLPFVVFAKKLNNVLILVAELPPRPLLERLAKGLRGGLVCFGPRYCIQVLVFF